MMEKKKPIIWNNLSQSSHQGYHSDLEKKKDKRFLQIRKCLESSVSLNWHYKKLKGLYIYLQRQIYNEVGRSTTDKAS